PDGATTGGFGASLALGDPGAAIGAPFAHGGRGRVYVYAQGAAEPVELAPPGTPPVQTGEEVSCADGEAGGFRCSNVDMQAFLTIEALGGRPGERVSDIWGWSDPATGREYALVGRTSAMVMVDVTDATSPRVVGEMPANPSGARDIKVYRNHAFLTGDGAGQHGLMVFDLTRLRGVTGAPVTFAPDTVYRGIASAHNLAIDTVHAVAIPVSVSGGGETCGGGLHLVDISNPRAPTFAGCYTDTEGLIAPGRTHDVQCVRYHGPDQAHQGRNICFASNETALRIVDVTDRANPAPLSAGRYPGAAYIHQGWLTDDHRFFYLNDELDELVGTTERTRTMIWDVSDLDDPVMVGTYLGPDGATDHNLFIKGNRMYQANYQAGFRVIDISDPVAPREVGFFDTTPYDGNPGGFYGAWTAYPFFPSGNVIVSSMQEGLFVLRPRPERLVP
ncbi:MAG: choice-of-anchor B family protein, partial [Gemmatimonadales bacterium]